MDTRTWGYRRTVDGLVEGKIFDNGDLPDGWHDSPASVDTEADPDELTLEAVSQMNKSTVAKTLKARGLAFDGKADLETLRAVLVASL